MFVVILWEWKDAFALYKIKISDLKYKFQMSSAKTMNALRNVKVPTLRSRPNLPPHVAPTLLTKYLLLYLLENTFWSTKSMNDQFQHTSNSTDKVHNNLLHPIGKLYYNNQS